MIQFDAKLSKELNSLIPDSKSNDVEISSFQSRLGRNLSKTKSDTSEQSLVRKIDDIIDDLLLHRKEGDISKKNKSNSSGSQTGRSSEFELKSIMNTMEYRVDAYKQAEIVNHDNYLNSSEVYSFIQSSIALGQFETVAKAPLKIDHYVDGNNILDIVKNSYQFFSDDKNLSKLNIKKSVKIQSYQPLNDVTKQKVIDSSESKIENINYKSKMTNFIFNSERYALTYFKVVDSGFDYRVYYRDFNNSLTVEQLVQYISCFSSNNNKKAHLIYNGVRRTLHGY